ncbi:MAG: cobalamin-binding protein [Halobacteriaceae archaeon]
MSDRIVSLAPSATATLVALDAADRLVGVTDHCDADAPSVGGWLTPDYDAVAARDPDLVVTADPLQAEIHADLRERGFDTCHVEPATLDEALDAMTAVGAAAGLGDRARDLAADCRARIAAVEDAVAGRERPVVYCEEWQDPPMVAGNWVPDVVRAAGGRYPFVEAGERSREVDQSRVEAAAPAHVVLHVCGEGEAVAPESMTERGWDVPAVERGAVHVARDDHFNQPSPSLVDGIEWLAAHLHPDAYKSSVSAESSRGA